MHNNTFASKSTQHSKFQRSLRCTIQTVAVQKANKKNPVEIYSSLFPCSNQRLGESLSLCVQVPAQSRQTSPVLSRMALTSLNRTGTSHECHSQLCLCLRNSGLTSSTLDKKRQQVTGTEGQDGGLVDNYRDGWGEVGSRTNHRLFLCSARVMQASSREFELFLCVSG